jgi:Spy/CpxP family protein refolding chaperone
MKNPLSSIAILALSFIVGRQTFGAAVKQTDADVPAPEVQKYFPTPETNEALAAILNVNPQLPRGPNEVLEDYEVEMTKIASRMSNELGQIRQAIANGQLSTEQGESLVRERYQVAMMQYQLFSAWHAILEQAVAQASAEPKKDDPSPTDQAVVVALPFSSLQLNPSLEQYLKLTPEQSSAIRQVMARERSYVTPLMAEFNATRQKLEMATRSSRPDQKQIRSLALIQARLLTRLVAEDADLQGKISHLLNSEQRRKIEKFNQTNEVSDLRSK